MKTTIIIARLNGKEIYRRVLKNNRYSSEFLGIAINNAIQHDFKNYDCEIIYE